jgi:hypothetical protein
MVCLKTSKQVGIVTSSSGQSKNGERMVEGRYDEAKRARKWAGQPQERPDGFFMPLPLGGAGA